MSPKQLVRISVLIGSVIGCLALTGCTLFTIHSGQKEKIIRENETRRVVAFESDEAANTFRKQYERQLNQRTVKKSNGGNFSILFICHVDDDGTVTKLSPNAVYNDCIDYCDLNRDGVITEAETRRLIAGSN